MYENLLEDKTAVITGGASGIGREIAIQYAEHGADTVIADKREHPREGGTPTHEEIERKTERDSEYVECDVADPDQIRAAIEAADGNGGLDVLVNDAAIAELDDYGVDESELDEFYDVNLKAPFHASRMAAERMDEGSIVNISSVEAIAGTGPRPVYGSTRGALRQMTFALADRFGPEIRVNVILPGLIDTEMVREDVPILEDEEALEALTSMTPLERPGDPEEVAAPAVFLASDLASYITGSELVVDGGLTHTE